jgi:Haemolymph juvenile hormone binding protein (JHBP)
LFSASSLIPCRFKNPKLDTCIKDTINTFLPSMRQKLPNIDLPSLEPIVYQSIGFTYKSLGTFQVKNFKGFGISRAKVQNVLTEFKDDQVLYNSDFFVPKIHLTGNYKASVMINNFKMNPKGQFNITLKNVSGKLQVQAKTDNVDGDDFLKIYKFDILPAVSSMKFSISGLFSDANLSKLIKNSVKKL